MLSLILAAAAFSVVMAESRIASSESSLLSSDARFLEGELDLAQKVECVSVVPISSPGQIGSP